MATKTKQCPCCNTDISIEKYQYVMFVISSKENLLKYKQGDLTFAKWKEGNI